MYLYVNIYGKASSTIGVKSYDWFQERSLLYDENKNNTIYFETLPLRYFTSYKSLKILQLYTRSVLAIFVDIIIL